MSPRLRFARPQELSEATARRDALLASLDEAIQRSAWGTRPQLGPLSPGCAACGRSDWSCLFISGSCPAGCFFCPTRMNQRDAPRVAERVRFDSPEDYAAYVEALGYGGVGISGGEPFLDMDLLVAHIRALRERLGSRAYLWVYTSGLPITPERVERVASAGADEVRFNIVHCDYALDAVRAAVGLVPRVTVEIPAVPEDLPRLKQVLPAMAEARVSHLNLHQLMVLGHNAHRIAARSYLVTPERVPAVPASELCALELMVHAVQQGIDLPIQLCGVAYKGAVQMTIEDQHAGPLVQAAHESRTTAGYLRRLWVEDQHEALSLEPSSLWSRQGPRLLVHPSLLDQLPPGTPVHASWHKSFMGAPGESAFPEGEVHQVDLPGGPVLSVHVVPMGAPVLLEAEDVRALARGEVARAGAELEHPVPHAILPPP